MVRKAVSNLDVSKETINSGLLIIISILLGGLMWQFQKFDTKLDKVVAYINADKGKKGDKDLISRIKLSHTFLYGKKEDIYYLSDYVQNN